MNHDAAIRKGVGGCELVVETQSGEQSKVSKLDPRENKTLEVSGDD